PVDLGKQSVGDALDQRQDDEDNRNIESPFAQAFGEAALVVKKSFQWLLHSLGAFLRFYQPAPTHCPFWPFGSQPVENGKNQCAHAEPFMQPVHLVESV